MHSERVRRGILVGVAAARVVIGNLEPHDASGYRHLDEPASEISAASSSDVGVVEVVRQRRAAASRYEFDRSEGSSGKIVLAGATVDLVEIGSHRHGRSVRAVGRPVSREGHVVRHVGAVRNAVHIRDGRQVSSDENVPVHVEFRGRGGSYSQISRGYVERSGDRVHVPDEIVPRSGRERSAAGCRRERSPSSRRECGNRQSRDARKRESEPLFHASDDRIFVPDHMFEVSANKKRTVSVR